MFNEENWKLIIILTVGITVAMTVAMVFLMRLQLERKQYHFNKELNRIELERMRELLEGKIYDLNYKLSEDNERWNKMNHLIYDSQKYISNEKSNMTNDVELNVKTFLENAGLEPEKLLINKKLVFVLSPFHNNEWATFETIRNVCNSYALDCQRGDEEHIIGDILPKILKSIIEARIVIVNLNGRNPNVFYELGIAHALGKKTILISKFGEKLPFDIQSKSIILYKDLDDLKKELHDSLAKALV
ncbi:hypothetical protein J1907_09815 [Lysinibacillus sphaericus]|uniref:hypothetical protein n=1 Tax=Lysinibacillus sphaericus TaxID=1421 RepID=UPI000569C241|nr:hypothetical protein [Lysinibacillus sphaericus]QTB24307.1 hypothetical protein J1907_09815 [Lysinibacillus sphaericus]